MWSPVTSDDEAAINQAVESLRKAMVDTDRTKLSELTADNLSYGHSAGKVETKAEFIDGVMGKKTIFKTITLTEPLVAVTGNNAVARHIFAADLETDGKPGAVRIGILQVWAKQDGGWKLFARQAFRL
jgi:ketosteroid isomerase-like protein